MTLDFKTCFALDSLLFLTLERILSGKKFQLYPENIRYQSGMLGSFWVDNTFTAKAAYYSHNVDGK